MTAYVWAISPYVAPVREDSSNVPAEFEVSSCKRGLLHDMADRSAGDLTSEEKNRLYELLVEFADVFAESSDDMGRTGVVKHSIDTGTSHPIRQQCRRVPPFRREQAKKMIDDMLHAEGYHPTIIKSLGISNNSNPEKGWISPVLHRLPQVEFCHPERCLPPPKSGRYLGSIEWVKVVLHFGSPMRLLAGGGRRERSAQNCILYQGGTF